MELRCNNCNEILDEFGCDYEARVSSSYIYNEEECKFELYDKEELDDSNVIIYCLKCGKTLSDEISSMLDI